MGGINHQPCRQFLGKSTLMSRSVSLAGISIEGFNVRLEGEILKNLNGEQADVATLVYGLREASNMVAGVKASIKSLRQQMSELYYVDLPAAKLVNLPQLCSGFSSKGMVAIDAAEEIAKAYAAGGFESAIAHLDGLVESVQFAAGELLSKVERLHALGIKNIAEEFETNGDGNIRPEFAVLYTAWTKFHQQFLASSLISTEIYYKQERCGSLIEEAVTA